MAYLKQWAPRSLRNRLDPARARAAPGYRHRDPRRRGRRRPARSARSTSRTSTLPTTSTATSRTTTCGRRWSRGTHPSTTASRASGSTRATIETKSAFNRRARDARMPARVHRERRRPSSSSCPTTTRRGSRSTSSLQLCSRRGGARRRAGVRLRPLRRRADRHAQPRGRAGRRGVAPPQPRVPARVRGDPAVVERVTAPYGDARVSATPTRRSSGRDRGNDGVAAPNVNSPCFTQRK